MTSGEWREKGKEAKRQKAKRQKQILRYAQDDRCVGLKTGATSGAVTRGESRWSGMALERGHDESCPYKRDRGSGAAGHKFRG